MASNTHSASSPLATTTSSIRATKRKLDDAFQILDEAVTPEPLDRPELPRRTFVSRSFYSTLAKYGVNPKKEPPPPQTPTLNETLSKSAPHLSAILSRVAKRSAASQRSSTPPAAGTAPTAAASLSQYTEYRPSSISSFLARLSTFKLATYSGKPQGIDAVAAAKCGWTNNGKDRLVCGLCNASWVVVGRQGMSRDAANALLEKQKAGLVDSHRDGCPWKTRQCDPSIYRVPLQAPSTMLRELKYTARVLTRLVDGVHVKHPLSASQLNSIRATVTNFDLDAESELLPVDPAEDTGHDHEPHPISISDDEGDEDDQPPLHTLPRVPSDTALLVCLFGWGFAPPPPPPPASRTSSLSSATPSSHFAPHGSASAPISRSASRSASRAGTPVPESISQALFPFRSSTATATATAMGGRNGNGRGDVSENAVLYCSLCQRRVGLWTFMPPPPPPAPTTTTTMTTTAIPLAKAVLDGEKGAPAPVLAASTPVDANVTANPDLNADAIASPSAMDTTPDHPLTSDGSGNTASTLAPTTLTPTQTLTQGDSGAQAPTQSLTTVLDVQPSVPTPTTTVPTITTPATATATATAKTARAAAAPRQFDLIQEHRAYCPFVVKSTSIPTLPVSHPARPATTTTTSHVSSASDTTAAALALASTPTAPTTTTTTTATTATQAGDELLEGWRALLTLLLRYGNAQRQRQRERQQNSFPLYAGGGGVGGAAGTAATAATTTSGTGGGGVGPGKREQVGAEAGADDEPMEIDEIKAMVEDVKSRGGRELLKYVKGLLG